MSLLQARAARDAARQALANPADVPIVTRTFEEVAREWHRVNTPRWDADYAKRIIESLEADAFPAFGGEPIDSITPPMVLEMLRKLESRGAHEYVRKLRQRCSAAFVFGIASGVAPMIQRLSSRRPWHRKPRLSGGSSRYRLDAGA
jgi:integrase